MIIQAHDSTFCVTFSETLIYVFFPHIKLLWTSLRVLPNKSQFFQYESFSLSCGEPGKSSHWRVIKNTSTLINEECPPSLNERNESHCLIDDLYPSDTGVYWCESGTGECSNTINITVAAGPVILESPVLPVMEGDDVTLSCKNINTTSSSNLTTNFYKNGFLMATSSTGNITIHSISKSDEGFYKCNISGVGQSPDSWLAVRGRCKPSQSPLACILLPVVGFCLLLASLMLFYLWRRLKGKLNTDVSYTDVIITQQVEPKRIRDVDAASTVYSTVKPGTT
ncbi:low affinity immunoglobulin gamma Fc region receptor II-c-like isoform X2 [Thunnus thynnus]|uniref:low affinity immunoglobulin gamma Fc region receptor II-c-like isoform X2 n=1 Tax=Thunnus thynnus TaxID=8237 RepID=UPI003528F403